MLHRAKLLAGALCALAFLAGPSAAQQATAPVTAIYAGRLLADPSTGRVLTEQTILVGADGKIVSINPGYNAPAGATVIDQRNRFVLPGLIDSHVHLTSELNANQLLEE